MGKSNKNANGVEEDTEEIDIAKDTEIDEETGHVKPKSDRFDEEMGNTEKTSDTCSMSQKDKNMKRAIFAVVILMVLCIISTLIVLKVVGHAQKEKVSATTITNDITNDNGDGFVEAYSNGPYIPPEEGSWPGWTTTSTVAPENNDFNPAVGDENENGSGVAETIAQDSLDIPPSGNSSASAADSP